MKKNKEKLEEIFMAKATPEEKAGYIFNRLKLLEKKVANNESIYTKLPGPMGLQGIQGEKGDQGSPDTGLDIINKINALDLNPDFQIDFKHIKNIPWEAIKRGISHNNQLVAWGNSFSVSEIDGSPLVPNIYRINFPNGSVTDNTDGTVDINISTTPTWGSIAGTLSNQTDLQTALNAKQATLVSATNIKTINSASLLGAGDIAVQATLVSGTNIKTINSTSLLGSGDIAISASPAGSNTYIQYNNSSAFGGDANFTWNSSQQRFGIGGAPSEMLSVIGNINFGLAWGNTYNTRTGNTNDNPLTAGATTINYNVNGTTVLPASGTILIDSEMIDYTSYTSTQFLGCTRGKYGTSAASHAQYSLINFVIARFGTVANGYNSYIITNSGILGDNVTRLWFGLNKIPGCNMDIYEPDATGSQLLFRIGSNNGTQLQILDGQPPNFTKGIQMGNMIGGSNSVPDVIYSTNDSGYSTTGGMVIQSGTNANRDIVIAPHGTESARFKYDGTTQYAGLTTKYNGIATVSNGFPSILATIDTTGLTANVAASTLYAVPASGAGMYRVSAYVVTTTAGSISSTMPNVQVVYTDKDSNTSVTLDVTPILGIAGLGQSGLLTANTVGTVFSGVVPIYVKASTTIQYQTVNYASNAAGMAYSLRIKSEAL